MADGTSSHHERDGLDLDEQIAERRTTITLVRHGESEVTAARVIGGKRTCRGLTSLGRTQAERLEARLRDDPIGADALVASDFARAIETAEIIRSAVGTSAADVPLEQRPDLGEHDPGPEIDGMTFEAYVEQFGTPDWAGDRDVEIFPGGETMRQFHDRVARGLTQLQRDFAGRHVVVVCHGGVIDATFRILLGLPMAGGFELYTRNTALTEFSATDSSATVAAPCRRERYIDAAHLAGLPEASPRRSATA